VISVPEIAVEELDERGFAVLPNVTPPEQCEQLAIAYDDDLFRSTIAMARHGFGRGEYKYFRYPLPGVVEQLRSALYPQLVPIANAWAEALGSAVRYPPTLPEFLDQCHRAMQTRPTPLMLRYGPGDYNCLHQDLYGETHFPLQAAILLSDPNSFSGGEFILTEQRPRRQSRVSVVPLDQGDAVIFAVRDRPVRGSRGFYRVQHRHGVSELRSGRRHTLGIIFHDAA
jgi:hypothetical protein